jgi:hypothetical protein
LNATVFGALSPAWTTNAIRACPDHTHSTCAGQTRVLQHLVEPDAQLLADDHGVLSTGKRERLVHMELDVVGACFLGVLAPHGVFVAPGPIGLRLVGELGESWNSLR